MAEVFDKDERLHKTDADSAAFGEFLLNDGLDLLAAYRSIPDLDLRLRIKQLINDVAALSARLPAPSTI